RSVEASQRRDGYRTTVVDVGRGGTGTTGIPGTTGETRQIHGESKLLRRGRRGVDLRAAKPRLQHTLIPQLLEDRTVIVREERQSERGVNSVGAVQDEVVNDEPAGVPEWVWAEAPLEDCQRVARGGFAPQQSRTDNPLLFEFNDDVAGTLAPQAAQRPEERLHVGQRSIDRASSGGGKLEVSLAERALVIAQEMVGPHVARDQPHSDLREPYDGLPVQLPECRAIAELDLRADGFPHSRRIHRPVDTHESRLVVEVRISADLLHKLTATGRSDRQGVYVPVEIFRELIRGAELGQQTAQ